MPPRKMPTHGTSHVFFEMKPYAAISRLTNAITVCTIWPVFANQPPDWTIGLLPLITPVSIDHALLVFPDGGLFSLRRGRSTRCLQLCTAVLEYRRHVEACRSPFSAEMVISAGRQYATIPALSLEQPNYAARRDSQHGFEES